MTCYKCGQKLGIADIDGQCSRCAREQDIQKCGTSNGYDTITHALIDGCVVSKASVMRWLLNEIDNMSFEVNNG